VTGLESARSAAGLAPSGARIVILERGERIVDTPETRDERAIFQRGVFRPIQYAKGATPGWPFDYDEIQPWCTRGNAVPRARQAWRRSDGASPFRDL
jgi:hypothetical protein